MPSNYYICRLKIQLKTERMSQNIASADGKLGILLPGMGAVATTLIAGVYAVNKGISKPIGSTSQMGTIRIGKRTENNTPLPPAESYVSACICCFPCLTFVVVRTSGCPR